MANPKKTPSKTPNKKSNSMGPIKPFDGKIVPFGSENKPKGSSSSKTNTPKSNTSKPSVTKKPVGKTSTNNSSSNKPKVTSSNSSDKIKEELNPRNFKQGKVYDKKVIKKDGKTTVTYQTLNDGSPSKVRKIYDDKGNLIKGNQRVSGGYGSYKDIGIKGKKVEAPKAKTPVSKTPVKQTPSKSKSNPAYIKGVVEGLDRPQPKKKVETVKPKAPDMSTKLGSVKVSVPSKGKVKIEPNLGKPKSMTPPKTETKKVTPKVAPKAAPKPELIKMETVSSADAAKKLMESREMPKELAGVKPAASEPKEEKKGIFARMKERREARKAEKERGSAGEDLAMRKGGMVKYKKGGSIKKSKKK